MLYPIEKQAYKLKLPKKKRVYKIFHMSLIEQNNTKKGQMSKKVPELDTGNEDSKKYKVEAIWNSTVYANKLGSGHLLGHYYLATWKSYPEEKNT